MAIGVKEGEKEGSCPFHMSLKRPTDAPMSDDDLLRDAKRRRMMEQTKEKVARGGRISPGDFLMYGSSGLAIWRPSLCVDDNVRQLIQDTVFAWQQDAPDYTALFIRSYLLTGTHGLTREQLKLVPECIRSQSREALGVVEITQFAFFAVDEDRIIELGRTM